MTKLIAIHSYEMIPDKSSLISMMERQFESTGSSIPPGKIENALKNALRAESRSLLFLLGTETDVHAGFAFCNICSGLESGGDYLWINELFVEETFRGRTAALDFITGIESWCSDNDIVYIACVTGKSNHRAAGFYRKAGFSLEDTVWVDKKV